MPLSDGPQADLDGAVVRSEMDRAVEQADQRLPQTRAVGEQRARKRFELKIEFNAFSRSGFLRGVCGGIDQLFCVDWSELEPQDFRRAGATCRRLR